MLAVCSSRKGQHTSYELSFPFSIQIYFKNRRARESQKSQQLPGKIGSLSHCRPNFPKADNVPVSAISTDSVCQRHLDVNYSPQYRPSSNSPQQESNFSLIDQPLEEMCFSKSLVIEEHQRQTCRELPRKLGHLSSDWSGSSNVPSPPDVSASADSLCERPSGLSFPPLLSPSNITPNSETTFSMCQTPPVVSPLPEPRPLNDCLDQMAIFSKIDQACKIYLNNTSSRKQLKQRKKSMVKMKMQGQDSCAKPPSPKGTVFLLTSAFDDILSQE